MPRSGVAAIDVTIAIRRLTDAVEFGVRVAPGARRSAVVGVYGDRLKAAVKAPPERGKANSELCGLLAAAFDVSSEHVAVIRGLTSRDKTVRLSSAAPTTLERRLQALAAAFQD